MIEKEKKEAIGALKQGRNAWHWWRLNHEDTALDLREADLSGISLKGVGLAGCRRESSFA